MVTELEKKGLDTTFKKIMFFIGMTTGILNLFFWTLQIAFYFIYREGEPFFGEQFFDITYKWGIAMLAIIIFTTLFVYIKLLL